MNRGWRIALRLLLALSLLANAAVLGVVLRLGHLRTTLNGGSEGLGGLPRALRLSAREAARADRAELSAAVERLGRARAAMFAAARAGDAQALAPAMAEVRAATTALQRLGQDYLMAAVTRQAALRGQGAPATTAPAATTSTAPARP